MEVSEMIRSMMTGLAIIMMLLPEVSMAQNEDKERSAVAAAEKWLAIVDEGKKPARWGEEAGYFRKAG